MWIFVIWIAIFNWLEGFAINGIANAALPAIERQFKLTSSKSSLIPAAQDIGALILILFVSYIGGRYNKAVWIACGSLIMAVGSFFFIIPHIAEKYQWEGTQKYIALTIRIFLNVYRCLCPGKTDIKYCRMLHICCE